MTCRGESREEFEHDRFGQAGPAEGVSAPLEPTKLTPEEAKQLDALINEVGDGYGINPSCCSLLTDEIVDQGSLAGGILRAFRLGRAAVSKNLQEELTASQLKVRKYKRYFCDKDTCSPLLDSCESETTCCLPCHLDTAEARIVELEKEIAALRLELCDRDRQIKGLTEDAVRLIDPGREIAALRETKP